MTTAYPLPHNETKRLAALDRLQIIGTPRAPDFDAVLALALQISGCRVGVIGLMEGERHWFKAERGLDREDTPRHLSLCNYTLLQTEPLIVEDLRQDPRFCDNPFVKTHGICFYAGVALSAEGGLKIGTLCVIGEHPRAATPELVEAFRHLGCIVESLLENHSNAVQATALAEISKTREQETWRKTRLFEQCQRLAKIGYWVLDTTTGTFVLSDESYRLHEMELGTALTLENFLSRMSQECRDRVWQLYKKCTVTGESFESLNEFTTAKGNRRWEQVIVEPEFRDGKIVRIFGTTRDVTVEYYAEQALRKKSEQLEQIERMARIGAWEYDLETNITHFSDEAYRLNGIELGTPIDIVKFRAPWPQAARERSIALFEKIRRDGESYDYETEIVTAGGARRWMRSIVKAERRDGKIVRIVGTIRDMTAEHLVQQALRDKNTRLEQIERLAKVGAWELDVESNSICLSEEARRIYDVEPDAAVDLDVIRSTWPKADSELSKARFRRIMETGESYEHRSEFITIRGNRRWQHIIAKADILNGKVVRIVGSVRDVTDEHQAERRLWRAAHYDALTQAPNRHYWTITLDQAFDHAIENRNGLTILMFDLDGFKEINDTRGHSVGDAVLCDVARRLAATLPADAFHARLGGDEFAILLQGNLVAGEIEKIVRNLLAEIQRPIVVDQTHLQISGTFGCASFPADAATASDLMQKADIALYQAKRSHRNSFVLFRPEIGGLFNEKRDAIDLVAAAIEQNRLVPFYQPKIDLKTGRSAGFEALCRIEAADGTILGPAQFLPALQDPASAARIGVAMLDLVTADIATWLAEGLEPGRVAINVTGADFLDGALDRRVLERLDELGLPASALEIEVTENTILGKEARMVGDALQAMRDRGIVIALDDFGTGFASLTHLRDAPIDYIKLDRSFISGLGSGADSAIIVKSIVDLGHSLGMRIVAEGIETAGQGDFLRAIGCDEAQGFLFGRPASQNATYMLLEQQVPSRAAFAG